MPRDGAQASEWHQALMDLGATVCTTRRPKCNECPVNDLCAARPQFSGEKSQSIRYAELSETMPALKVAERAQPTQQGWIGTARYYRGRIVEALRGSINGAIPFDELGPRVREDYSALEHEGWLKELLAALERDGLVVVQGGGVVLPE